ncbi:hypothetical protein BGZ49_001039 [Haplosporangium sp. Z 27]|nr:hypothetical protein BGZ49_001039 [Haplosporangium sp. Z 27]
MTSIDSFDLMDDITRTLFSMDNPNLSWITEKYQSPEHTTSSTISTMITALNADIPTAAINVASNSTSATITAVQSESRTPCISPEPQRSQDTDQDTIWQVLINLDRLVHEVKNNHILLAAEIEDLMVRATFYITYTMSEWSDLQVELENRFKDRNVWESPGASVIVSISYEAVTYAKYHMKRVEEERKKDPYFNPPVRFKESTRIEYNAWCKILQEEALFDCSHLKTPIYRSSPEFKDLPNDSQLPSLRSKSINGQNLIVENSSTALEFEKNFMNCKGDDKYESQDKSLKEITLTSAVEISLHSFVIDGLAILDGLDEDIKNRILLDIKNFDAKFVQSLTSTTDECRNKFELATIQYYSSTKQYTKYPELLGMGWLHPLQQCKPDVDNDINKNYYDRFIMGIHCLLQHYLNMFIKNNNSISHDRSESWYIHHIWGPLFQFASDISEDLDSEPGEWYSRASSQRRNKKRENLSVKKTPGHKCDWAFISCQTNHLEIAAVEVKASDDDPNGTDCLKDNLKLSKLLKDMFDMISTSMRSENLALIKSTLALYGIIISGLKLEIVQLSHFQGRYYRLSRVEPLYFPERWSTCSIIDVIRIIIFFSHSLENMSSIISDNMAGKAFVSGTSKNDNMNCSFPETLTTPPGSPISSTSSRSSKKSKSSNS